jgi:hypothetical protein
MPSGRLVTIPRTSRGSTAPDSETLNSAAAYEPARIALRVLVFLAALVAMLAVASPAGAAKSCGRAVIDDWYDDGRVDGTYALHCYDDAIEILPRDVRDYSSAKEDIQRALQAAKRGDAAPPARTDPTPGEKPSTPDDPDNTDTTETTGTPPADGPNDPPTETLAGAPTDTESASSVPIPLLILAGLALLLVAGGTAGYVIRRVQARRLPPPPAV